MKNQKEHALSGKGNKRLNNTEAVQSEGTAAWANASKVISNTHVTVPSEMNTVNAKDWVDDGSKL